MRFFVLKRKKNVYFRVFISHTVYLPKSVAEILLAATDLLVRLILALVQAKKTRHLHRPRKCSELHTLFPS